MKDIQQTYSSFDSRLEADHKNNLDKNNESNFLNSLAQEIKNPLSALVSYSEILQKDISNPLSAIDCIDYAREINNVALELNEIIDDLIEIGMTNFEDFYIDSNNKIDIADVIKRSIRLNYAYALKRRIIIESNIDHKIKTINLNAKITKQVITNLIANSIKHSPNNTKIIISANLFKNQSGHDLLINIKDHGFGMTEQQIAEIFKIKQVTKKEKLEHSFGFGLSFAKKLVEMQNGTIEVISRINEGTEVRLKFSINT